MTAPRITAEEIASFRKSNASLGCLYENDADDIIDALESAYAELDRLRSARVAVEVPGPDEFDVDEVLCEVANVGDYEREIAYGVWERIRAKAAANSRPAPPHPDTVELSRAYLNAMEECILQTVDQLQGGFVVCRRCGDQEDTATLDVMQLELLPMAERIRALRAKAQPATEREGT